MYITAVQLAERPGATEIAQVATPDGVPVVDAQLMDAVLRGNDTSAWSPADVAVANQAMARVTDAMTDADGLIDGFLAKRGYTLPLSPVPSIVTAWARQITRYMLHKDRITDARTDPIARDYQDALKLLQQTAIGQFSLGIGDTTTVPGIGFPQTTTDQTYRPGPWEIYE